MYIITFLYPLQYWRDVSPYGFYVIAKRHDVYILVNESEISKLIQTTMVYIHLAYEKKWKTNEYW